MSTTPLAGKRKRRSLRLLLAGLAGAGLLLALSCGGGVSQRPAPGVVSAEPNSKFAVVATSGGVEHRRTVTVVMQ